MTVSIKRSFFVVKLKDIIFVAVVMAVAIALLAFLLSVIAGAEEEGPGKLAVIIDDFGQARQGVKTLMEIDRKMTCAVMPALQFSEKDMKDAVAAGHEVIIHIPLQYGKNDNAKWVGTESIKISHSDKEINEKMSRFIEELPLAAGANIHMGALGSTDKRVMTAVMETLNEKNLYFVDSRTSGKTVCASVAEKVGIRYGENKIFLENRGKSKADIKKQLMRAAALAKKRGSVIAIGHVGAESPYTAQVIKECAPEIEALGVEFVFASELVK